MTLYNADGVNISFPYIPYQCQETYMKKVIECLKQVNSLWTKKNFFKCMCTLKSDGQNCFQFFAMNMLLFLLWLAVSSLGSWCTVIVKTNNFSKTPAMMVIGDIEVSARFTLKPIRICSKRKKKLASVVLKTNAWRSLFDFVGLSLKR